jgi:hypothetical protein
MTAIHEVFWGMRCESAAHVQHFAENITHTMKVQRKRNIYKRVKNNSIDCTAG